MSKESTLLIVDDEPFNLEILEELLSEEYKLIITQNGEECLANLHQQPDLILMDVNMPVCNGIEACKKIKSNPDFADIPVIFVSALATSEEKMAGYEAGGDDYITKPFDEEELQTKITLALATNKAIIDLKTSSAEAMSMAMAAMATAGGVGTALQFSHASFQCKNADELAQLLLDSYASYGLAVTIRYVKKTGTEFYTQPGKAISNAEKEILETLQDRGRFVDFGKRTLMNYDLVSVLVKNMPIEDEDMYGRMKDNLGFMGDAAEARARSLEIEIALNQLLNSSKEILLDVDETYKENAVKNESVLSHLHLEMEAAFQYLEISAGDEDRLISILIEAENKSKSLYNEGLHIEEKIATLMTKMDGLL